MSAIDALRSTLSGYVDRGEIPGLVWLVATGTDAHLEAAGTRSLDDDRPLPTDALFRIASLTKPVAAAVAMTFVDDGTLRLADPVDPWLPELAERRVLRHPAAALDDTVPADRAITVLDLLTFRLGFGSGTEPPGSTPVQRAEEALQLATLGPPWPPPPLTPDEWIARFGTLPLMHQPGEQWRYNTGAQVLGVLLERVAGRPLARVFRERLLDPLGMVDTGFHVPAHELDRLVTAYYPDDDGRLQVRDRPDGWWSTPPALPNAAGWLVSTIGDYWRFARMLVAGGVHDGRRILSPSSVGLLTIDHLTAEQRASATTFLGPHSGWGLGMAVPAAGDRERGLRGGYGWDGGLGTTWRSDPATGLTGILFTQREMTSPEPPPVFVDFWEGAYATLDR